MEMYNPNNNPFSTEPDDESEGNTQEEVNEENKKETGSKKKDKEITPKNNFVVDQMINSNISNLDDFLSKLEQFNNDWENVFYVVVVFKNVGTPKVLMLSLSRKEQML